MEFSGVRFFRSIVRDRSNGKIWSGEFRLKPVLDSKQSDTTFKLSIPNIYKLYEQISNILLLILDQ